MRFAKRPRAMFALLALITNLICGSHLIDLGRGCWAGGGDRGGHLLRVVEATARGEHSDRAQDQGGRDDS